jgi:hypothetical protein
MQSQYEPVKYSARGQKQAIPPSIDSGVRPPARIIFTQTRTYTNHIMVWYKGAVRVRAAGSVYMDQELLGFSLSDFVPTIWELVPWSFLIDYFTNIGDVLEAWTTCTSDVAWVNRTSRRSSIALSEAVPDLASTRSAYWQGNSCRGNLWGNPGWVKIETTRVVRSAGISDSPRISLEIPGFGRRWINIGALIAARRNLRNLPISTVGR